MPSAPGDAPAAADRASAAATRVLTASISEIAVDPQLQAFVRSTAQSAIEEHCASCHGANLHGRPGVPNLVDYDWLWGIGLEEANDVGPVMEIEQTILYGVRNKDCPELANQITYGACPDTRYSEMPAYGTLGVLNRDQIGDLVEYVVNLSGRDADVAAAARAEQNWPMCAECHGAEGQGYKPYGGPDLSDDVWLYGGDRETITDVIVNGRHGVCPPWGKQLDAPTIKAIAVYIWQQWLAG
jgi:cytochrome c oxidase cbb3-type subunit 3